MSVLFEPRHAAVRRCGQPGRAAGGRPAGNIRVNLGGPGARLLCPCANFPTPPRSCAMASAIQNDPGPDQGLAADQVLAAERAHLASSRQFVRLILDAPPSLPPPAAPRPSHQYPTAATQ